MMVMYFSTAACSPASCSMSRRCAVIMVPYISLACIDVLLTLSISLFPCVTSGDHEIHDMTDYLFAYYNLAFMMGDTEIVTLCDGRTLSRKQMYLESIRCDVRLSLPFSFHSHSLSLSLLHSLCYSLCLSISFVLSLRHSSVCGPSTVLTLRRTT